MSGMVKIVTHLSDLEIFLVTTILSMEAQAKVK